MTQPGFFWGSDVPISLPVPSTDQILVDEGATGITIHGLQHNMSQADLEEYSQPTFQPPMDSSNGNT